MKREKMKVVIKVVSNGCTHITTVLKTTTLTPKERCATQPIKINTK